MNPALILLIAVVVLVVALQLPKLLLPKGSTLDAAAAKQWMKDTPDLQLIDVRTKPEHMAARIATSKLIPLQELEGRLAEIDKAKPVLLYCASGGRSASALGRLIKAGYQAKHMAGGLAAWRDAGFPVQG
jgi:rhodanese-related sulfurtransferase